MLSDTVIEDARWEAAGLAELAERAARATLERLGIEPAAFEIAVMGCDDARIAVLNEGFRGRPSATNVLSWPGAERGAGMPGEMPSAPEPGEELGDIAISFETCAREARAADRPLAQHATHLIVHATLHLLGFDHIREADAALMEGLEVEILGTLGISDPYVSQ